MRALLAIGLVAALAVSGCLHWFDRSPDWDAIHAEVEAAALPLLVYDEDLRVPPPGGSMNMRLVAYHNGWTESGDPDDIPPTAFTYELAVGQQHVYMTRNSADGAAGGFSIIDVSDPSQPRLVGSFDALSGSDIEVNDEETFAFFGTQRNTVQEMLGRAATTQDPSSAQPRGIYVVDISQKEMPVLDNFVPLPYNGVHTLTYARHPIDNQEYLIVATYDLYVHTIPIAGVPSPFPVDVFPFTQRVLIYRIMENPLPGGPRVSLVQVGQYQILEQGPGDAMYFPHDTFVQMHPLDGRPLLYVAYWDKGVRILDWSDAADPVEIGAHTDFSPSRYAAIHQVKAFDHLIAGRHVTVAEPEIISSPDETGQITFIDTTDPARPSKAGHWTLPGDELYVRSLEYSPHNFDLWEGKVALAHYHAGVWIIDVSNAANLAKPKSVGFYMAEMPRQDSPVPNPMAWSAFWKDGLVYVSDEALGLLILEYTGP